MGLWGTEKPRLQSTGERTGIWGLDLAHEHRCWASWKPPVGFGAEARLDGLDWVVNTYWLYYSASSNTHGVRQHSVICICRNNLLMITIHVTSLSGPHSLLSSHSHTQILRSTSVSPVTFSSASTPPILPWCPLKITAHSWQTVVYLNHFSEHPSPSCSNWSLALSRGSCFPYRGPHWRSCSLPGPCRPGGGRGAPCALHCCFQTTLTLPLLKMSVSASQDYVTQYHSSFLFPFFSWSIFPTPPPPF